MADMLDAAARACATICTLVDGDRNGAADAQIVLEGVTNVGHLTFAAAAAQLIAELDTLRNACRADRMAFADETTRWINDPLAAISVVATIH